MAFRHARLFYQCRVGCAAAVVVQQCRGAHRLKGFGLAREKDYATAVETPADKKNRMAAEGKSAMAEHAARNAAVDKNTVRLRALRLAKEAADRAAELANPTPPKPKRKPAAKKAAAKKLPQ
jgi:hypothetical protein